MVITQRMRVKAPACSLLAWIPKGSLSNGIFVLGPRQTALSVLLAVLCFCVQQPTRALFTHKSAPHWLSRHPVTCVRAWPLSFWCQLGACTCAAPGFGIRLPRPEHVLFWKGQPLPYAHFCVRCASTYLLAWARASSERVGHCHHDLLYWNLFSLAGNRPHTSYFLDLGLIVPPPIASTHPLDPSGSYSQHSLHPLCHSSYTLRPRTSRLMPQTKTYSCTLCFWQRMNTITVQRELLTP